MVAFGTNSLGGGLEEGVAVGLDDQQGVGEIRLQNAVGAIERAAGAEVEDFVSATEIVGGAGAGFDDFASKVGQKESLLAACLRALRSGVEGNDVSGIVDVFDVDRGGGALEDATGNFCVANAFFDVYFADGGTNLILFELGARRSCHYLIFPPDIKEFLEILALSLEFFLEKMDGSFQIVDAT